MNLNGLLTLLGRTRSETALTEPKVAPAERFLQGKTHRAWVDDACADFFSKRSSEDTQIFRATLAKWLPILLNEYSKCQPATKEGKEPFASEERKAFVDLLFAAISESVTEDVWHRKQRLKSHNDVYCETALLQTLVERLGDSGLCPGINSENLASLIAEHAPSWRAAHIVLGELRLAANRPEQAIDCSKSALAIDGSCPTAQSLARRAWQAKLQASPGTPPPSIALQDLKDRFCSKPFDTLVTADNSGKGYTWLCDCAGWLPFSAGNVLTADSVDSVWNSEVAQEIRRSVLDGDYTYCSRMLCPFILGNSLPKKASITDPLMQGYIADRKTILAEGPRLAQLSHDATCNLACPSCRTDIMMANAETQDRFAAARDRVVLPLLKQMNGTALITGWGDPFASKHYRSILTALNPVDYPGLRLTITTNGLLLTPKQWEGLKGCRTMIDCIQVSIDAATPETYEKVRRPGKWSQLMPNLEFISSLRRTGEIRNFGINFVVQKLNFREMADFVKLGIRLSVDRVLLQKLWNMGAYTPTELTEADVTVPTHPLHGEFMEILRDPIFAHPSVNKYNIRSFFDESAASP